MMPSDIVDMIINRNHSELLLARMGMKASTMKLHVRRYLYRVKLYLRQAVKALSASNATTSDPPFSVSPCLRGETHAASRFFFIVVEVREEDQALIRLMQVNPSVAAAIQLPEGCRFRTCFEISAEYANVVINM
jgi:hypothetical protein